MKVSRRFTQSDSVVDLVEADYNILPLLSRFSLPLGFGDKTIGRACDEANIDVDVFLLVINHIITRQLPDPIQIEKLRPMAIVDFCAKATAISLTTNSRRYAQSYCARLKNPTTI